VIVIRPLRDFPPQPVALRRHVAAWAVIASLFALLLGQPFHASAPARARGGAPALLAAAGPASALASPHDADFCSMCRASAQTRLGLRTTLRAVAAAPTGASLVLKLAAPAPIKAAPLLRQAQPRAPPSALPLVSA
jgi:hypothetical protein